MKIITTVGTSIFENYKKDKQNKKDTDFKTHFEKIRDDFSAYSNWNECESRRTLLEVKVKKWYSSKEDSSAEIASILKIAGVKKPEELREKVEVVLLSSDTVLSKLACDLIYEWFKPYDDFQFSEYNIIDNQKKHKYNLDGKGFVIQNLRISDNKDYEKGFMRLIEVLDDLDLKPTDVLNITGGYKAIIPILTIYGQLENVPLKYIYNEQELGEVDLIEVKSLPINFDYPLSCLCQSYLSNDKQKITGMDDGGAQESLTKLGLVADGKVTVLGTLLSKYADKYAESNPGIFGDIVELVAHKQITQKSWDLLKNFDVQAHGWIGYRNKENNSYALNIPKEEQGKGIYDKIELDFVLKNGNSFAILECKSFGQFKDKLGKRALEQKAAWEALNSDMKISQLIFLIHKFDFQEINLRKNTITKLKKELSNYSPEFYTIDVPFDTDKVKFGYQNFIRQPPSITKEV
jgi:hypothetical protein